MFLDTLITWNFIKSISINFHKNTMYYLKPQKFFNLFNFTRELLKKVDKFIFLLFN